MAIERLTKWNRNIIANVFYDENVKKIWFHLGDLCIDGKKLDVVAKLIQEEKIQCFANVPATVLKDREAAYQQEKNALLLSPLITLKNLSVIMESILLHEGVHAFIDYKKLSKTAHLHNEAAAYVAQGLFLRNKKEPWPAEKRNDPIIRAVEALIDKFKMTSNKTYLHWNNFKPLMKAIQDHPSYLLPGGLKIPLDLLTPADGITKKEVTGGSISKRALAAKQPGPLGHEGGVADSSQSRGPLGRA